MQYVSRVTSKGTITLPAAIRTQLSITPGVQVHIDHLDGAIRVIKDDYDERLADIRRKNAAHLARYSARGVSATNERELIERGLADQAVQRHKRALP